jgi:putative PIG3 family NAD(P)H quinone oxidoreductase
MRACVITKPGGPEVLQVQQIEDPVVGPEDVLVQVKATALNRTDLAQRQNLPPVPSGIRRDVPGLEMAGVVAGVGQRVSGVKVGDRVFALLSGGGYAERVVSHQHMVMPIPDNLSFVEAASIPEVFFTAYDALFNQCYLQKGEAVLLHAVGSGVGTAAVQLAHHFGALTFGTAGSAEKLQKAAKLGLDVGINYREEDFLAVVRERTQNKGVNVILDHIGAPYWERNLASLAILGRIILVGALGGDQVTTSLRAISGKRLRVFGTGLRARSLEEKIALTQQFKREVIPLLASGHVRPVVDRVFPLEQAAEAHAYMEANLNFGKIVLSME